MKKEIRQVEAIREIYGDKIKFKPSMPNANLAFALHDQIRKESKFFADTKSAKEAVDNIASLLYSVYYAASVYGISGEQLEKAFKEVCDDNKRTAKMLV